MMYVRFPLSLRNVEDLLFERGIDICHETVRHWWNRFGPMFASDIRRQRVSRMRGFEGDTLEIGSRRIRLFGIDVPELSQTCDRSGESWACGAASAEELRSLIGSYAVTCEVISATPTTVCWPSVA